MLILIAGAFSTLASSCGSRSEPAPEEIGTDAAATEDAGAELVEDLGAELGDDAGAEVGEDLEEETGTDTVAEGAAWSGLTSQVRARLVAGTPGCVGIEADDGRGARVLSIVQAASGRRFLRLAGLSRAERGFVEERSWALGEGLAADEGLAAALAGPGFVTCQASLGEAVTIARAVPVSVTSEGRQARVAIEGNRPLTIELAHELGRWRVQAVYHAAEVADLFLRLVDPSGGGDDGGGFALVHVAASALGESVCVPRPIGKPLGEVASPPFDPTPDALSCVAMTASGDKAAFKTWRRARRPGVRSEPDAITWVGPGATPAIDLGCMAKERCGPEEEARLAAAARSLGLVGCAAARGAWVVDGRLASFRVEDDALLMSSGGGWRPVRAFATGPEAARESLWKVFQPPRGGPIYLYVGVAHPDYETVRVEVLDEVALGLCERAPAGTLAVRGVTASGAMRGRGGYRFGASEAVDGDLTTSWQPGPPKKGQSPWIELSLDGEQEVVALEVANGFQRRDGHGDLFALNARAAEIVVSLSDGASEKHTLSGEARGFQRVVLSSPRKTTSVRVTIGGHFAGTRWPDDVAISELRVMGP